MLGLGLLASGFRRLKPLDPTLAQRRTFQRYREIHERYHTFRALPLLGMGFLTIVIFLNVVVALPREVKLPFVTIDVNDWVMNALFCLVLLPLYLAARGERSAQRVLRWLIDRLPVTTARDAANARITPIRARWGPRVQRARRILAPYLVLFEPRRAHAAAENPQATSVPDTGPNAARSNAAVQRRPRFRDRHRHGKRRRR